MINVTLGGPLNPCYFIGQQISLMARKFWTLLPDLYFTHKQSARGGRQEVLFTAAGCLAYYFLYTSFHSRAQPGPQRNLLIKNSPWF